MVMHTGMPKKREKSSEIEASNGQKLSGIVLYFINVRRTVNKILHTNY